MFERQDSNSRINVLLTMDGNTVQVVPTCEVAAKVDGNIPDISSLCDNSYDSIDAGPEVSYIYSTGATNVLGTDAIYAIPVTGVQSVESNSIMNMYDGIKDPSLMDAATQALIDGTMTPLIKEELKYSIQSKRLKEGKPELKVEFIDPEPDQLTEDEIRRVETRKVQNRMAARRFRERQKSRGDQLQKECQKLQAELTRLRFELSQVKKERDGLRQTFNDHMAVCPLRYQPNFYTQPDTT